MRKKIFLLMLLFIIVTNISANQNISLTDKEKAFIKNHPVIKVGNDKFWPPFDFYEDNQAKGFSVDYLKELGAISGLNFEFIQDKSWEHLVNKLKTKQLDILTALEPTVKTKKFALFSDDILVTFESMITQKKSSNLNSYKDLYGKKVGIIKGYDLEFEIRDNHKQIDMVLFDSPVEALKALSNSQIDVVIENTSVALYLINKYFISNLKLNSSPKFPNLDDGDKIKVVSRIDYPELHSIIQKSIKAISSKKKKDLKNRWMSEIESGEENKIHLTMEEKKFIKNNIIKVGVEQWSPAIYSNNGSDIDGIGGDFFKEIVKNTGLTTEIVSEEWSKVIADLESKTIDVIPVTYYTKKREEFGLYGDSYFKMKDFIYMKQENNSINSLKDLEGKVLAITKSNGRISDIQKSYPNIKFAFTKDYREAINLLLNNKADAIYDSQLTMNVMLKEDMIIGVKGIAQTTFNTPSLYIFTRIDKPILHSILQKGLRAISEQRKDEIKSKWLNTTTNKDKLNLTLKQVEYLKNKKVINLCIDPNWLPIEEFNEENKYIGMSADYFNIFKNNIDLIDIKTIQTKSWDESLKFVKERKCDIISAMQTPLRDKYLNFTSSYIDSPLVIATKLDIPFISDFKSIKDKQIGITRNYAFNEILKNRYSNLNIVDVENIEDGLKKVNNGELFGYIGALATIGYQLQTKFIGELKITGKLDEKLELSIGVRDDDIVLHSILQKAIDSIDDNQKLKIKNSWLLINYDKEIDYTFIYKILFVVFIIALFIVYRQFLLKKQNKELMKLSTIDPMTGAYNRRYLYNVSKELTALAKREKKHLSIAMIDIDNFKKINDTYGHDVGDEVIKTVVNIMRKTSRDSDLSIRFGGEEFVILFPNTDIEQSIIVLEKIRKTIEESTLISNFSFTVSIGVSKFIYSENHIDKSIKRADEKLYIAKNSGKNRISK